MQLLLLFSLFLTLRRSECVQLNVDELGSLIGSTTQSTWTAQTIYQFLGIRYAKSPTGGRRYQPPVSAIPWPGTHDVQKHGPPCPNLKYVQRLPSEQLLKTDLEDCLHLSIYTKDLSAKRPVMFFIHGGAFVEGAAFEYPPNHLLEKDIVLIVPQYRLGPLGFLSTQSDDIPGNAGLLDLMLALEWTQQFIHHFGGDPSSVTVFGHSAGGGLASALLFSPKVSADLFHRVIVQSGSMFSTRAFDMNPYRNAKGVAEYLCDQSDSVDAVNGCLLETSVLDLLVAHDKHTRKQKMNHGFAEFGGAKLTFSDILPKEPRELIKSKGAFKNVSLMAGVTKHDGSFIYSMLTEWMEANYGADYRKINIFQELDAIIECLGIKDTSGVLAGFFANELYTANQIREGNFEKMIGGLVDMSGAVTLKAPLYRVAQLHAEHYPHQTYLYSYDYHGDFPYEGGFSFDGYNGTHHYADVLRLFPLTFFKPIDNDEDLEMSKRMVSLWTSFAISGTPKADGIPEWLPLTNSIGPYMHIDRRSMAGDNFLMEYSVASRESRSSCDIEGYCYKN